jgi:hypothetical protein
MQDKRPTGLSRRNFFRVFGGASTAAVAAAAFTPGEAQAYDPGKEETRARYRETDHVKAFYRVNRYPAKK